VAEDEAAFAESDDTVMVMRSDVRGFSSGIAEA